MAPKPPGLVVRSMVWVLVVCLLVSTLTPLRSTYAAGGWDSWGSGGASGSLGSGMGGGYSGGNVYQGDLGGWVPKYGGGESTLFEAKATGGVGSQLGCGLVNYMDFVKATFNVADIGDQLKEAMKTYMAKMILTYLMSIPVIAAAYDFINFVADAKLKLFNQKCDIAEARRDGAKLYKALCNDVWAAVSSSGNCDNLQVAHPYAPVLCQQAMSRKGDINWLNQCMEGAEPIKALMKQADKTYQISLQRFLSDPVGCFRDSICNDSNKPGAGFNETAGCLAMSYLPRLCFETGGAVGSASSGASASARAAGCVNGRRQKPPISYDGVAAAFVQYSLMTMSACADVWDSIRRADPNMEPATIKAIGNEAVLLANEATTPMGPSMEVSLNNSNGMYKLAFTDMSLVLQAYGADATTETRSKMLEDYRTSVLNSAPDEMIDPLRMCKLVAQAARKELNDRQKLGVTIPDPKMPGEVNAALFFNLPNVGTESAALAANGLDAKAAAKMLEMTFGYIVNVQGGVNITNPVAMAQLALSSGDVWTAWGRTMGMDVSCMGMDRVIDYVLGQIAKAEIDSSKSGIADGSVATKETGELKPTAKKCDVPLEAVKDQKKATFDYLRNYLTGLKTQNAKWCANRPGREDRIKQFFGKGYNGLYY